MTEIITRKASPDDLDTLLRFEQGVIAAERPFDSTLQTGPIHYYDIPGMISAAHIELLVAVSNGQVVGSGYARIESAQHYLQHSRYAYLGFMYTDPAYRGLGINRKIINALKSWVLDQHVTELRLEVYVNNAAAIRAYEKAGFSNHLLQMRMGL
jgi:ribosomal protein S18 acetylase RimI-like enzyme